MATKKTAAKKTPAKKTAVKKTVVKKAPAKKAPVKKPEPTHEQIAELARKYFHEHGGHGATAEEDWLRAERELKGI
jgi:hypothetical protein